MSNQGKARFASLSVTGNPVIDAVLRYVLVAAFMLLTGIIMGWLNAHGFHDPQLVDLVSTAVAAFLSTVALAAWGIIRTSKNEFIVQLREAIGVQAGINLAAAGQAEMVEKGGAEVPKPVTVASAQQIIADHASPIVITPK